MCYVKKLYVQSVRSSIYNAYNWYRENLYVQFVYGFVSHLLDLFSIFIFIRFSLARAISHFRFLSLAAKYVSERSFLTYILLYVFTKKKPLKE